MQARYYDPVGARFLSVDPVTFMETGNPAMFNRYAYAFNDPVNLIDPDGENPISPLVQDYYMAKALGLNRLNAYQGQQDNYGDARRHSEWNYMMTKTLNTGRYGAATISYLYEVKGMFGENQNSPGARFMDLNNNKEGRRAAIEGREINDKNLITKADGTSSSGYTNQGDYYDGAPANSVPPNSISTTIGNSTISATSSGANSIDITVTTRRPNSRIRRTKKVSCTRTEEGEIVCK